MVTSLPEPRLTLVLRLDATLAAPWEVGEIPLGRRRIITVTGGTFTGPETAGTGLEGNEPAATGLAGTVLAGTDWQTVLPDGTTFGDIRYTLQTHGGDLLDVRMDSIRHGRPEVLARLAAGENVDPSEYVFRAATRIQTAAPALAWLNRGVFVSVGGRGPGGVSYATYLVG